MSLNASGVRDTSRSLHIYPNTVLRELKKKEAMLESVNTAVLRTLHPDEVAWDLERAGEAEAEMDEMCGFGHMTQDTCGKPYLPTFLPWNATWHSAALTLWRA